MLMSRTRQQRILIAPQTANATVVCKAVQLTAGVSKAVELNFTFTITCRGASIRTYNRRFTAVSAHAEDGLLHSCTKYG